MHLKELRIEASKGVCAQIDAALGVPFRWTVHHVREIFTRLLPFGFALDGSSVVQLTFGPGGGELPYRQVLGCSEFLVEDFDFAGYAIAPPKVREGMLLDAVEGALHRIASPVGKERSVIAATALAVRERSFRLEYEIKKLRKLLAGSRDVVRVYRSLSADHGESWFCRRFSATGSLRGEYVMGQSPGYLNRSDLYCSALVQGRQYCTFSRLGKETFRFDVT